MSEFVPQFRGSAVPQSSYESWRLLIDGAASGAVNMARDEALLLVHAGGASLPTLRLYRWSPACLSLGRFQRSGEVDRAACAREGITLVRRPSGGRALLHDDELTYAIVAPENHKLAGSGSILDSYRRISQALLAGMRRLGVEATLAPVRGRHAHEGGETQASGPAGASRNARPISAACFDTPASYELTVAGRKLAGSAQARAGGALLQHGAIPLTPHADRLGRLLLNPTGDLGTRMVTLDQSLGRRVTWEELADALVAGLAETWSLRLVPGTWSANELVLAEQLRQEKYTSDAWTFGR
jgi:lipoate-protein ligase A